MSKEKPEKDDVLYPDQFLHNADWPKRTEDTLASLEGKEDDSDEEDETD